MPLLTQPNTRPMICTYSTHTITFGDMCSVSHNPQAGSTLTISYRAHLLFLEVDSLYASVTAYRGGKDDIRDMEGMIQQIAQDAANALDTGVCVGAYIRLHDGSAMTIIHQAIPMYTFQETR